jgi:hypothetical protein
MIVARIRKNIRPRRTFDDMSLVLLERQTRYRPHPNPLPEYRAREVA